MDLLTCILADDLTGAGDTGVQFQKSGYSVYLSLQNDKLEIPDNTDVLVLNSDSRFLTPDEAYTRVYNSVEECRKLGISKFYKKIDSTLRGNIKEEVDAALNAAGLRAAVIAPSAPGNDRRVLNGHCYIGDTLIHNSDSGRDALNPVHTSFVPDIFNKGDTANSVLYGIEELRQNKNDIKTIITDMIVNGARYIICDAETDSDLEVLSVLNDVKDILLVGSSGLAGVLYGNYNKNSPCRIPERIHPSELVIINGSRMEISREQVHEIINNRNVCKIPIYEGNIINNSGLELERVLTLMNEQNNDMSLLIQTSPLENNNKYNSINDERNAAENVSNFVGTLIASMFLKRTIKAVILIGGDTSSKVLKALSIIGIEYLGEVLPGIPFGRLKRSGQDYDLYFLSKSGGFGESKTLTKLFDFITGKNYL